MIEAVEENFLPEFIMEYLQKLIELFDRQNLRVKKLFTISLSQAICYAEEKQLELLLNRGAFLILSENFEHVAPNFCALRALHKVLELSEQKMQEQHSQENLVKMSLLANESFMSCIAHCQEFSDLKSPQRKYLKDIEDLLQKEQETLVEQDERSSQFTI